MILRDLCLDVINKKTPPRIPMDLYENGIHWSLLTRLLDYFNLNENQTDILLHKLNACARWGLPYYKGPAPEIINTPIIPVYPQTKVTKSIWGVWVGNDSYSDTVFPRPLANVSSVKEVTSYAWPDPDNFDYNKLFHLLDKGQCVLEKGDWAKKHSGYLRIVGGWNPILCHMFDLLGMEKAMKSLLLEPVISQSVIDCISGFYLEYYERLAKATCGYADILAFGDDFASQNEMMISPDCFRKYFLPKWRSLFAIGHRYGMKNMMHMCGCVRPVMRDLINAGLDIYENLVTNTADMRIEDLKREYGGDLIFYGGIDVQQLMPFAPPAEVYEKVSRFIEIAGAGGGLIISTCHYLTDDVPLANVIAMQKAAGYPI